jgi:phosphate transport system substrate-binding protein
MNLAVKIIIGFVITVLSFFIFLILSLILIREVLWALLAISYLSIMLLIILYRKERTKKIFLLLCVPVVSIGIAAAFIKYNDYVESIPVVSEYEVNLNMYQPFTGCFDTAYPEKEASFKIEEELPVLDGATALYPVYAKFVNAVYPEGDYNFRDSPVLCSKTDKAYENLFDGKADIIFCAGPSDSQIKWFLDAGIDLELVPIGKEAFVFFVNRRNQVKNLNIENIQGIYSGKIKNWKELGGANIKIRPFQRKKNSGSQTMLENIMGGNKIMKARRENMYEGMIEIISEVARYRNFDNAIGYSFLRFTEDMAGNNEINLLSINGIHPSIQTIQDGSYPFSDNFYAIYNKENKNKNIKPFIDWILSDEGQKIIVSSGYVSVIP